MIIENTWGRALAGAVALVVTLGVAPFARAAEAAAEEALEPTPADDLKVTQAASLDDLLRNVEQRRVVESREHANREAQFARDKAAQAKMLADAQAERAREELGTAGAKQVHRRMPDGRRPEQPRVAAALRVQ